MKASMQSRNSLILVTVDCLRADHVGFLGYPRPTTPFLDALANASVVIPAATVAGAPTYYSFPALLASRYPLDLGRDVVGLAPGESTLTSALKHAGYTTAAFCAGNPYLTPRFGYQQSFDHFRDFLDPLPEAGREIDSSHLAMRTNLNRKLEKWSHKSRWAGRIYEDLYFEYCQRFGNSTPDSLDALRRYPAADVLVNEAIAWVKSIEREPFFLWLHFMDPHAPYYPVQDALQAMGSDISASRARYLNSYWNRGNLSQNRFQQHRRALIELYDAGIRWVDTQLARFAGSLLDLGIWDNCVLALTADHGEEFLDHGGRFHSPDRVADELLRVPLLLRVPGQGSVRTGKTPFSLLHLAPTLLEIVGVDAPHEFQGHSCWQHLRERKPWDEPALTECVAGATNPFHRRDRLGPGILTIREERFKLVWDLGTKQETLFDLQQDPMELHPIPAGSAADARRRLTLRACRHLVEYPQRLNQRLRFRALMREMAAEWNPGNVSDVPLSRKSAATQH
jgi:arylsulfatase A-like enzyme